MIPSALYEEIMSYDDECMKLYLLRWSFWIWFYHVSLAAEFGFFYCCSIDERYRFLHLDIRGLHSFELIKYGTKNVGCWRVS